MFFHPCRDVFQAAWDLCSYRWIIWLKWEIELCVISVEMVGEAMCLYNGSQWCSVCGEEEGSKNRSLGNRARGSPDLVGLYRSKNIYTDLYWWYKNPETGVTGFGVLVSTKGTEDNRRTSISLAVYTVDCWSFSCYTGGGKNSFIICSSMFEIFTIKRS